jgi:hypothetical protein
MPGDERFLHAVCGGLPETWLIEQRRTRRIERMNFRGQIRSRSYAGGTDWRRLHRVVARRLRRNDEGEAQGPNDQQHA